MNLALDNDEIAYWVELAEITNGNSQGSLTDFKKHIETLGLSRSEFSRYQRSIAFIEEELKYRMVVRH